MSDTRRAPSVSGGTGIAARAMRAFVLGSIQATLAITRSPLTSSGPTPPCPSVVAFHHTAPVDAFMIGMPVWRAGGHPIAMIKASIARHPVSGPIVRTAGMIPVARHMDESRSEATAASLRHLAAGHVVHIAPGATIHPVAELPHWRAGAARIAQQGGVPLVPAVAFGPEKWGGHGSRFAYRARTPVHASFGDPIHIGPQDDPIAAMEAARAAVATLITEHTGVTPTLLEGD